MNQKGDAVIACLGEPETALKLLKGKVLEEGEKQERRARILGVED